LVVTDVWGQPIGPIFKGQDCLMLYNGTNILSRNVGASYDPRRAKMGFRFSLRQ
jgi:hypothetical protein